MGHGPWIPKKDGAYVINLDEYAGVGTDWIALFCNGNEIVYFDSFGVEHSPKEIKEFIGNKNKKAKIFRVQANDCVANNVWVFLHWIH